MSAADPGRRLCRHGAILFLVGLLNGAVVSALPNSRMGLSAHLAGVQNGMVLLLFGLLWGKLLLSVSQARLAEVASIVSLYAIWAALFLAAVFGTSRVTPIAGAGYEGAVWQELLVAVLLYAGSAGILLGAALVVYGLRGNDTGGQRSAA